ncbi:MAG: DUF3267 domain-containing protein [Pirellulales bacterium]
MRSISSGWAGPQAALGIIPCLVAAGLMIRRAAVELPPAVTLTFLLLPALLLPLHELAHAIGYGVGLRNRDLISGIWPAHGIWYVLYDGPLPRSRVLSMLVAPLLLISGPLFAAAVLSPGPYRDGLRYLAWMHTSLCVGDLLTAWRIVRQVPRTGWIHNRGWDTYWSVAPEAGLTGQA